jgi:Tfp pilus assembly protein PilO
MDLKDPKLQKFLLLALVGFLVIYFWYARIYSGYSEKISLKQTEYEILMTDLKNVEMKAKSMENLKDEYQKLLERYQKVELLLPEERKPSLFLNQMHSAAQVSQTNILEITPQAPQPVSFYNILDFNVQIQGTYHQLGHFFANVANFPFMSNISSVSMVALPAAEMEKSGNSITASFKLSTYYIKEEERLKKLEF